MTEHKAVSAVPAAETQPVLDARDIARILGVSPRTVQRMFDAGEIPDVRQLRNRRVVPTAVFRQWLSID